jgi:ZIP family zinc transporter
MLALWQWFRELNPVYQALVAGGFTWLLTALGAALVLFTRRVRRSFLDGMLGFAAGVMIAASVWSLIIPASNSPPSRGPSHGCLQSSASCWGALSCA